MVWLKNIGEQERLLLTFPLFLSLSLYPLSLPTLSTLSLYPLSLLYSLYPFSLPFLSTLSHINLLFPCRLSLISNIILSPFHFRKKFTHNYNTFFLSTTRSQDVLIITTSPFYPPNPPCFVCNAQLLTCRTRRWGRYDHGDRYICSMYRITPNLCVI